MLLDASCLLRFAHRGAAGPGPWTILRKCSPQVRQCKLILTHLPYCSQHIGILNMTSLRLCLRCAHWRTCVRGLPRQLRHGRFQKDVWQLLPTPIRDEGDRKVLFDFARLDL